MNGVNGHGIFVTQNQVILFDLEGKTFKSLTNLENMAGFTTAIPIEGKYMATALGSTGVKIFSVDYSNSKLKLETTFNSSSFKIDKIDAQDLAFD